MIHHSRHSALEEVAQRQTELGQIATHIRFASGIRVALHALQIDLGGRFDGVVREIGQHDVHLHCVLGALYAMATWVVNAELMLINLMFNNNETKLILELFTSMKLLSFNKKKVRNELKINQV